MARIRTIKPEFWTSEQIVECSTSARLLFVGLWCFCDDGGVHPRTTKRIKMEVFPGDDFSDSMIEGWLSELISSGLLTEFEADGRQFIAVSGWRHQKIERPTYKWPQLDDVSASTRRILADVSATPHPRNGREGKGCIKENTIKRKSRKFVKPTAEQVEAYCLERNNGIGGQEFCDHYDRVGWVVGRNKTPMKDWRAAVRTWEANRKPQETSLASRLPTAEEDALWTP